MNSGVGEAMPQPYADIPGKATSPFMSPLMRRQLPPTLRPRPCNRDFTAFSAVRAFGRGDSMDVFELGGYCGYGTRRATQRSVPVNDLRVYCLQVYSRVAVG